MKRRKNMKTRNLIQVFVIALAMIVTLTIGSSMIFGKNKADNQSTILPTEEQGNDLVGVWEEVEVPAETDCATGLPFPGGPIIRALYSFSQGGTMYVEDNAPFDGPYRSTGAGSWKRVSGRSYAYVNLHYAFNPDKTFRFAIKQRANLTLSQDSN